MPDLSNEMQGGTAGKRAPDARHRLYRRSFKKTIWTIVGVATGLLGATVAGMFVSANPIILALSITLLAASLLVLAGGLLVLNRHDREIDGRPDLFWRLLQDIEERPPAGMLRLLFAPRFRAGTVVRVRPPAEILATLDDDSRTEGIPFMPEMFQFCGREFPIHRVVDKINDWTGRTGTGLRRLNNFVTLRGLRCDGSQHGGCQADCQILWHEKWLTTAGRGEERAPSVPHHDPRYRAVLDNSSSVADGGRRYTCQITELVRASKPIPSWDIRQDVLPLVVGNVDLRAFLVAMLTALFNFVQRIRGGMAYPMMPNQLSQGPTPDSDVGLQKGESVVTRSKSEIGQTLYRNRNRGLWFGAETMRFCGQKCKVRNRVQRFIDENTGELVSPKSAFIVLEGVTATGEFLRFCPQNEFVYWREIWLKRDEANSSQV